MRTTNPAKQVKLKARYAISDIMTNFVTTLKALIYTECIDVVNKNDLIQ